MSNSSGGNAAGAPKKKSGGARPASSPMRDQVTERVGESGNVAGVARDADDVTPPGKDGKPGDTVRVRPGGPEQSWKPSGDGGAPRPGGPGSGPQRPGGNPGPGNPAQGGPGANGPGSGGPGAKGPGAGGSAPGRQVAGPGPTAAYPRPAMGSAPKPGAAAASPSESAIRTDPAPDGKPGIRAPRKAHLVLRRVEPWSAMKFSFVLSLVCFVVLFVAVAVLYGVLSALGVFDTITDMVTQLTSGDGGKATSDLAKSIEGWFDPVRILGYTALLGAVNVVLITALSTLGAVIYNLSSSLVGGVEVTFSEAE
ncbi:DUF3566 domain-containing protein [Microtetraspora niveoalba]|uniref:DUF3566 domain-containing protein n=1 Tax=Microtetraspora niveoalba TaxID=46175 RepID=UPI000ABEE1F8|nr:DUF3566 domain-containing protein [Microtetraspora niveoalba]